MAHCYAKILRGPEHFVDILHAIAVPAPELMAWTTIFIELVGERATRRNAQLRDRIWPGTYSDRRCLYGRVLAATGGYHDTRGRLGARPFA